MTSQVTLADATPEITIASETSVSPSQAPTQPASNKEITALVPGFIYLPPCPPELAKPTLRPPVAR